MLRPDPVFVRKLKRLEPRLECHWDDERERWIITETVRSWVTEYDREGTVIRVCRDLPHHVMIVQTALGNYHPLDDRVVEKLAMECDMRRYAKGGPEMIDKAMELQREMRARIKREAEEERQYWYRHEKRRMREVFENAQSGIFNDPVVPFEPQTYSFPSEVRPCISATSAKAHSERNGTVAG